MPQPYTKAVAFIFMSIPINQAPRRGVQGASASWATWRGDLVTSVIREGRLRSPEPTLVVGEVKDTSVSCQFAELTFMGERSAKRISALPSSVWTITNIGFFLLFFISYISPGLNISLPLYAQSLNVLPHIVGPNLGVRKNFQLHSPNSKQDRQTEKRKQQHTGQFAMPEVQLHSTNAKQNRETKKRKLQPTRQFTIPAKKLLLPVASKHPVTIFQPLPPSINRDKVKQTRITKASHLRTLNYYRGLYLNNVTIRRVKRYQPILNQAKKKNMNALVVDVQPFFPKTDLIQGIQQQGFYLIARIVVFPGGLKSYPPREAHLQKIYQLVQKSAKNGFNEIQLDYIRFSDYQVTPTVSLQQRYDCIEEILKQVDTRLEAYGVPWGADLFGRISFNQNDRIGQKLELFSSYVDTIYPMLYPSHFYGMPQRIKDPYTTVLDGIRNASKRVQKRSQVIAFIQAFRTGIKPSQLSFVDYISKQITAAKDAGASGYIAWNSRNQYDSFFRALHQQQLSN